MEVGDPKMTYAHIQIAILSKEAFLHASREQLGTWLLLYAYCATQENSGRIRNCLNWAPATWYAVTRSDRPGDSPIWVWHDNDLVLIGYDIENQKRSQKMRKGGIAGARKRWNIHPDIQHNEPEL